MRYLLISAALLVGCTDGDDDDPVLCSCNSPGVVFNVRADCSLFDEIDCGTWEAVYCSEEPEECESFTEDTEFVAGTTYSGLECTLAINCSNIEE